MDFGKVIGDANVGFERKPIIDLSPQISNSIFDLDVKANNGSITKEEIDSLNTWFKKNKDKVIRLYHGTSAEHDVMNQGLLPTSLKTSKSLQSGHGFVYLTYDPQRAKMFAQMAYPNKEIAIYSVDVPIAELKTDSDQLKNKRMYSGIETGESLAESLLHGGGFRVKGKIQPYQIKQYKEDTMEKQTSEHQYQKGKRGGDYYLDEQGKRVYKKKSSYTLEDLF